MPQYIFDCNAVKSMSFQYVSAALLSSEMCVKNKLSHTWYFSRVSLMIS